MNVEQILDIPQGELEFIYPNDARTDRIGRRFTTLRVQRQGLRLWDSFEEDPAYLQKFMKLLTGYPVGWKPIVSEWTRYLASETSMVDLLKLTLMHRVNTVLEIISPGTSIVGTAKHFDSYGTDDNRIEGAPEVHIGPDLPVFQGDLANPPDLQDLQKHVVTLGEAKVKHLDCCMNESKILPGTVGCYESWLAQAVQCCIDLDISIGWVQTNLEVVMFHLSKCDDSASQNKTVTTRSSKSLSYTLEALPSEASEEPDFSSPFSRATHDWSNFEDGDKEIPLISDNNITKEHSVTPTHRTYKTFESPTTPRRLANLPSSPLDRKRGRDVSPEDTPDSIGVRDWPCSSSQLGTASTSVYDADPRAEDLSHVLIRSVPLTDKKLGKSLLALIMLAKRAKDQNMLGIGPWKLSHPALDELKL